MNKPIFKILSIFIFALVLSLTSCKENEQAVVKTVTEPVVELKITTPAPSPLGKVSQRVGLTDIDIEYSRPGVKGRTIFGDLVTLDKMWRTGANKITI